MAPRLWLILSLTVCWYCAPAASALPPARVDALIPARVPTHITQREAKDCAIAALAMLTDRSWEDIDRIRLSLDIDRTDGMKPAAVLAIASELGVRLEYRQTFNVVSDEGIVVFEHSSYVAHAVYVYRSMVYDPLRDLPEPYIIAQRQWIRFMYALVRV